MYAFLIGNTVIKFDVLFPYFFAGYLLPSLYLIRTIANKYEEEYIKYGIPYKRNYLFYTENGSKFTLLCCSIK